MKFHLLQSFEAWNNLARCYVLLEEFDKAWNIFQEAAKRNYDNWQIWDNVLTVSAKCGHFDSVSILTLAPSFCYVRILVKLPSDNDLIHF